MEQFKSQKFSGQDLEFQKDIVKRFGIEENQEEFVIKTNHKNGEEVAVHLWKRDKIPFKEEGKDVLHLKTDEVVEAIQKYYPQIEKDENISLKTLVEKLQLEKHKKKE